MKYGIISYMNTDNLGDDILTYAAHRLLPSVDYIIDRENLNTFKSNDNELVATIFNGWFLHEYYNWPPVNSIVPLFIGFHYSYFDRFYLKKGYLEGIGKMYFNAYCPVGARDKYTCNNLNAIGIKSYFSGCLTLTLPSLSNKREKGKYICLVDLSPEVTSYYITLCKHRGIECRVYSHSIERTPNSTWNEKAHIVEERLKIYENAIACVTTRLHCALPCLALKVPVLMVGDDKIRLSPRIDSYIDEKIITFVTPSDVLNNMCDDYCSLTPPPNSDNYLRYRNALVEKVKTFVNETGRKSDNNIMKLQYTDKERIRWNNSLNRFKYSGNKNSLLVAFNRAARCMYYYGLKETKSELMRVFGNK